MKNSWTHCVPCLVDSHTNGPPTAVHRLYTCACGTYDSDRFEAELQTRFRPRLDRRNWWVTDWSHIRSRVCDYAPLPGNWPRFVMCWHALTQKLVPKWSSSNWILPSLLTSATERPPKILFALSKKQLPHAICNRRHS